MWAALAQMLIGPLVNAAVDAYKVHTQGQVDELRLRADLMAKFGLVFQEVAKSDNELAAKMFASFQQSLQVNAEIRRVWRVVVFVQLFVVFWYQFMVPALVTVKIIEHWAPAGNTVDWAYALLAGCVGLAPVVLKPRAPVIPKL